MKQSIVVLALLFSATGLYAQTDLHSALGAGDVGSIVAYFGKEVTLVLPGEAQSGKFSKSEAQEQLQAFYDAHDVRGFRFYGIARDIRESYGVGDLETDMGILRVYLYFDDPNKRRQVIRLHIEKFRDQPF